MSIESSNGAIDLHVPDKITKPPKQNRCFLRQKLAQQGQGQAKAEELSAVPLEQRQKHVVHAFSGIGSVASKLSLVLAQPEMDCEELRSLGFVSVKTSVQFMESFDMATDCPPNVSGIVIVNYGTDFRVALECCSALDQYTNSPPSIAVLVKVGEEQSEDGETEMQLVKTFLETGADDFMTLGSTETITGLRVQQSILRTEIMARKAMAMIDHQVEAVKKKAAKTLHVAWKRFMWDLPGKVLENIPFKDETLQERVDQNVGVGEYVFTGRLGAGTFGVVVKAEHPRHGTRALKVIAKSSVQNVCQLLSIDSELCIMTNLAAHPNVARAYGALHNEGNIILIIDCCGTLNLHNYITKVLKGPGATLPDETVQSFCMQEASAVAHLHAFMVCHRDLKPTNFIVSDDATTLRLTDFGLAVMACGPDQKLLHCCGSLPFAAPEVLRLQHERKAIGAGYNGFAADVWSLAVNFVELGSGLYSIERLLGWVPQPPVEAQQRLQDLEHFMGIWKTVPKMSVPGLHAVVDHMFKLKPEERWTIGQVVGVEGLGIEEVHTCSVHGCVHGTRPGVRGSSDGTAWTTPGPSVASSIGRVEFPARQPIHDDAEADELAVPLDGEDILEP